MTFMNDPALAVQARLRMQSLFGGLGEANYIGEPVSILEHSWQSYCQAKSAGETNETCVACLMHDIGHMLGLEAGFGAGMNGCGTPDHESIGADFLLALGFSPTVAYLVRNHVNAKRYLVFKDSNYPLSDASKITLGFQGGPMTASEAAEVEADPNWTTVIRMRGYDEAAKQAGLSAPSLHDDILPLVEAHVREYQAACQISAPSATQMQTAPEYLLSREQLRYYAENGLLLLRGLPTLRSAELSKMTDSLLQEGEHNTNPNLLVHRELVEDPTGTRPAREQACRVENFVGSSAEWSALSATLCSVCSQLFGEEAILFKDKVNFKLPGGGGFRPHQDATAYKTDKLASMHISVMVAIDPADVLELGPLEVALGQHNEGILPNVEGVINPDVVDAISFQPMLVEATDVVLFSSYLPHRSERNTHPTRGRRLAYLTYNPKSQGDHHSAYYAAKIQAFADGTAGGAISINNDFTGEIVPNA